MKAKKPRGFRISIRGAEWRVKFRPIPKEMWDNPDNPEVGACFKQKREIWVDPSRKSHRKGDNPFWTLLHESTHVALPDISEDAAIYLEELVRRLHRKFPTCKI